MSATLRAFAFAVALCGGMQGAMAQYAPPPPPGGYPRQGGYAPVPPLRQEGPPPAPPGPPGAYQWEPGHWSWAGSQYSWVGGHYIPRGHYSRFVQGHWQRVHGRMVWIEPRWR